MRVDIWYNINQYHTINLGGLTKIEAWGHVWIPAKPNSPIREPLGTMPPLKTRAIQPGSRPQGFGQRLLVDSVLQNAAGCFRIFLEVLNVRCPKDSQGFPRCIDRWCLCLRLSCDREIQPGSWMAQRLTLEDDWGCTKMHKGVGRCTDLQSGIKSSIEVAPNKSCASPFCWWQPNGSQAVTRAWHIVRAFDSHLLVYELLTNAKRVLIPFWVCAKAGYPRII